MSNAPLPEVLCAGLACLDMELLSCAHPKTVESIARYSATRHTAGGCAPQAARALAALGLRAAAAYPAACDPHGRALRALLEEDGVACFPVDVAGLPTALAVLPVFDDGRRGCFVSLGANEGVRAEGLVSEGVLHAGLRAFHCGYPHLLAGVRGAELRGLVERVRAVAAGVVVSVDVNGADAREEEEGEGGVLGAVLPVVDLLHANLEEACVISGRGGEADGLERAEVEAVVRWLCRRAAAQGEAGEVGSGAGIVCVTCGRDGVFAGRCGANGGGGRVSIVHRRAFALADGVPVNSSGAGDAFAAGAVAGLLNVVDAGAGLGEDALALVADAGLASARACLDAGFREVLRGRCRARGRFSLPDALMRLPSRFG